MSWKGGGELKFYALKWWGVDFFQQAKESNFFESLAGGVNEFNKITPPPCACKT